MCFSWRFFCAPLPGRLYRSSQVRPDDGGRPAGVVFRGHRVRPPAGWSGRVRAVDWTDARSRAGRREKDLRTSSAFSLERSSRWRGEASPEMKRSGVIFPFRARVTDQDSGVRGWREGCRSDWREHCVGGGGAGSGQPAASSESCQARRGLWTQDAVIFNAPGRRRPTV
jgi:hypothetical protein